MRAMMLLAAGLACGAAPPAKLTPEQVKLLEDRNRLWAGSAKQWESGEKREALDSMGKAFALITRVYGPWHQHSEWAAFQLASGWQSLDEWGKEAECWRLVIEARQKLHGERHWKTVDARLELAEALAEPKRTKAQREAAARAWRLNDEAMALHRKGDYTGALPLVREALKINAEVLGKRHPRYARSLNNLAMLLRLVGEPKAALPLCREALEVDEEMLGRRHPSYATSLHNLAVLLQGQGDFKAALPLLLEAIAIRKEFLGKRHADYADSLNNLALLLKNMGDFKAALPLYREALKVYEEALGRRHPKYSIGLNNLALLLEEMGDSKAALALHRQSLKVRGEVLGKRHPSYATSLNNLAVLLQGMGDLKEALPLHREALKLRGEVLGKRHPLYAASLHNLAVLLEEMGDHKAALPLFREALKVREEALGKRHPDYANSLNSLAMLLHEKGDDKEALPLVEDVLAIFASVLRENAAVQSDRQQLAAAEVLRGYLGNRLMLPDLDGHPDAAAHVLAWKGAVLLRQQQRRLFLRLASDPETKAVAERLQAVTRRLAALRADPNAAQDRFTALEKEQDAAQAELSRLSAVFRAERDKARPDAAALAKSLPEGVVLVDYLFYHDRLVAFVHRRGAKPARVDLGKAAPVEEAVREWRPLLSGGKPEPRVGVALKKLVLDPIAAHLEGASTLLLSPDGVLGTVPFAALPGKEKGTYLIEDLAVAVVPVPSQIPDLLKPAKDRLAPSLLVAGDLRYDPIKGAALMAGEDHRSAPRTGRESFAPLEATRLEILAVEKSFKELFKDGKAAALSKGDASKKAVREALPKARYAHFATHGWFAPEEAKAAEGKARPDGMREVVGWHPLLLSGLALSNANRAPAPQEEDGILTALEVSEMDLTKLELATLSACETGLGKVAGGEGLLGMQRAFAAAGARSVVASLWKVDDKATQALMADFYAKAWDTERIVSRAEALRAAQLSMLKEGHRRGVGPKAEKLPKGETRLPPYYWAAFVLSGDWR